MGQNFTISPDEFPNLPKLMLATIEALRALGGSGNVQEIVEKIVEMEDISEDEQSILMPNGRDRRLNYYLSWSRTFLKRGDALVNSSRGVWALTESGEQIRSLQETEAIHKQVNAEERERARQKRQAKGLKAASEDDSGLTGDQLAEEDERGWEYELLDVLLEIAPDAFERLAQRLLREAGFTKVEVRGKTGDGGIDGVGVLRVNLVSFQVYFQCKRWKGSVGSKDIRDFRGALQGRADKGLFITTGNFTSQATDEATRDGAIAIDLIDGPRLCELLKQYDLGVRTETVERVTIAKDWFEGI
jgi:restriction system protein